MATPAGVSKLDMSLDEIIKLNKKQQQKAKPKNKNKGPLKGQGSGGQRDGGGGKPSGGIGRAKLKLTVKKIRQKAKRTNQNSTPSYQGSKNKPGNRYTNRQPPSQSVASQSTGIKSRLGVKVKGKQGFTSQGQNRGGKSPGGGGPGGRGGQRPGSRLKAIRELKSARGSASRRRQGNAGFKQMAAQGEVKQGNKKPVNSKNATDNNRRGSGRGGRGRGKGLKRNSPASESQPTSSRSSPKYSPKPPARAPKPLPFDPPGIDLPLRICMDHHTSQPLHRRFTPQLEGQNTQRLVQKGGRTINYNK